MIVARLLEKLQTSNLATFTPRSMYHQLVAEFGVNLDDQKAFLMMYIDFFIAQLNDNDGCEKNELTILIILILMVLRSMMILIIMVVLRRMMILSNLKMMRIMVI